MKALKWRVFRQGSRTYFWSSFFFPKTVRSEVATLYAFVRTADDFVDQSPQDVKGFNDFYDSYQQALKAPVDNPIIDDFVLLMDKHDFDPAWVEAFFSAMRSDLGTVDYQDLDSLLVYIHGSAEVIGLMMARIMELPPKAHGAAQMLGRSMQLINFVRDIQEDNSLNRTYIPASWRTDLPDLTQLSAQKNSEAFVSCLNQALEIHEEYTKQATKGFDYIPYRCLVPIKTATDMYAWTAKQIQKDPFVVYEKKVKPSKLHVLISGLKNAFFLR